MEFQLAPFQAIPITVPLLELLIEQHETINLPRFQRLWNYYRNALAEPDEFGGSTDPPAQMVGLPPRLLILRRVGHVGVDKRVGFEGLALVDLPDQFAARQRFEAGVVAVAAKLLGHAAAAAEPNGEVVRLDPLVTETAAARQPVYWLMARNRQFFSRWLFRTGGTG